MPIEQLCEVMDRLVELDNDFEEMKLDILEIFPLEDAFFAMFARHICSGRPVLADCW